MKVDVQYRITLEQEADVGTFTTAVREICLSNQFDLIDTEQMVLACSEIGHNAVRHGLGGVAEIRELNEGKRLCVIIKDDGPGIPNIELAKREGFSTVKTSLGLGLEGAQRLVDHFQIKSSLGQGTTVVLEKYRPLSEDVVDYGLVSIPDNHYNYNGDQYILREYDGDSLIIGVIDGPGQGYDAHIIAQSCKQFVENNYRKSLKELIVALDMLMKESRDDVGITCSLARIRPGILEYIGVGDTHAYVEVDTSEKLNHLQNQEGRLGHLHSIKSTSTTFQFKHNITLVLCTDGIKTIYDKKLEETSLQNLANKLFDTYHRPYGDATILATKYKQSSP